MKLGSDFYKGESVDIHVDNEGKFYAEHDNETYAALTRQELLEDLHKAISRAKSANPVEVTVLGLVPTDPIADRTRFGRDAAFKSGDGVVNAKLRGKHGRNWGTFLFVTADKAKTKFQMQGTREATVARRLTEAEIAEYMRLTATFRAAESARDAFIESVQIDPEEALKSKDEKTG